MSQHEVLEKMFEMRESDARRTTWVLIGLFMGLLLAVAGLVVLGLQLLDAQRKLNEFNQKSLVVQRVALQFGGCQDKEIIGAVIRSAEASGLNLRRWALQIGVESDFKRYAWNKISDCRGLGQLDREKWSKLRDWSDPYENLMASARFYRGLYDRFGSHELALAAYNSGGGNVIKYKGVPPFKETRRYVAVILNGAKNE